MIHEKCTPVMSRHSKSDVRKSNSIELNRTQSVDWVRLSSAIERNRTPHFQWVRFPNKSNSMELNPSDCVRLRSETELNRTQLNGFRSIGSSESIKSKPVKASFSCAFFTIYSRVPLQYTFNASARLVGNFRIIGTLIPPPLCQRPLGSSNGGPQTLLKVKSMHKFCFPCFS